jgi:hypothetical protein
MAKTSPSSQSHWTDDKPLFYPPNLTLGNCSVCCKKTAVHFPGLHGSTLLCSDDCMEKYGRQFLQFNLDCRGSDYIVVNGRVFMMNWSGLQKNEEGKLCIAVVDPSKDIGEFTVEQTILIPLSEKDNIIQLPQTYVYTYC